MINKPEHKENPLDMGAVEFSAVGKQLVYKIAAFLNEIPQKPVTTGEQPSAIRVALGSGSLPLYGESADKIVHEAADLLFDHSLFNGHPKFWGYITSSATPIGALGDMLAAAVNPNVGAYILSPMATEIERQTVQWLSEFLGMPKGSSGLFVSGGNMANFVGFLAARKAKATWDIRKEGLAGKRMLVYCSKGTHTWIQKAADLFGLGTDAIRWIDMNKDQQIDIKMLEDNIEKDRNNGYNPFMVVGTAGSVSAGVVDDLAGLAEVCKKYDLWFHVDGAYGAPAAVLPELAQMFNGLNEADSIAMDPHKWLYAPLEAGCTLVKDARHLTDAFSFHPVYYNFDGDPEDPAVNYYDYGMQNSRGFRALKVWMALRQAGRHGYEKMIRNDIELAEQLYQMALEHEELEAVSQSLSITTFRFVPEGKKDSENDLNQLNEKLLNELQSGGKVFLSNAVIDGKYCLRACFVNFRTTTEDLDGLIKIVLEEGRKIAGVLPGS
ncbi:MAG TPA: aspartate aminotransferase family protein [Chitinophagaceae bacterium]|nr:aspartate aminotransferase family protein [Chitinophagaceae bacterium]